MYLLIAYSPHVPEPLCNDYFDTLGELREALSLIRFHVGTYRIIGQDGQTMEEGEL